MYLKGQREEVTVNEAGEPRLEIKQIGERKANEKGIQAIMMFLESILNPQVVQGNFSDEAYGDFLYRQRTSLSTNLMINIDDYEIREEEYSGIISNVMGAVEAFMSRLLNNEERKSYAATIRHSEQSSSTLQGKGGWSLPFVGGKNG